MNRKNLNLEFFTTNLKPFTVVFMGKPEKFGTETEARTYAESGARQTGRMVEVNQSRKGIIASYLTVKGYTADIRA